MRNIKRKILYCLMSVIICLNIGHGSLCFAEGSTIDSELNDALEVLRLLEIVPNDYYDYNTPFEDKVSRAEFVDTVANMIDCDAYVQDNIYYYDVPKTHFAYNSISALTAMGVLSGTQDRKFEPDEVINDEAAYKIILSIMGYNDYINYNGGYPAGCLLAAREADIFVASGTPYLTYEEMIRIMYKALTAKTMSNNYNGASSSLTFSDDTLLTIYRDIYYDKGVVTGADFMSLSDRELYHEDEVFIDNELYTSDTDISSYLGEKIEYYYHYNKDDNERTLIWAKPTSGNEVLNIEVDHNAEFDKTSFVYSYNTDTRAKRINFERGMLLIYNGRTVYDRYDEIFNLPRYSIKIIKTNGVYKTAIVRAYDNYVADNVDAVNNVVYDKINPTRQLKLDKDLYDYFKLSKVDGSEASVSDIKKDDVLSVFVSKDGKRLEAIIASESKSGTVERLESDNGGYQIIIDNKSYYIPLEEYKNNFNVGDFVKIYIDCSGVVAGVSVERNGAFAAYAVSMYTDDSGETVMLKLFTQDGAMVHYPCARKLTVDGKRLSSVKEIKSSMSQDGVFEPQLILVDIKDDIIKSIDTAAFDITSEKEDSSLHLGMDYAQRQYKIQGYFNFEAAIDNNTIVFVVPKDLSNADDVDYRIMRKGEFNDDTMHNVMSYNVGVNNGYEQYVVKKEGKGDFTLSIDLPVLITKNSNQCVNDDGDVVEEIKGYRGSEQVSLLSDGTLSFEDLHPGMVVRFAYDNKGTAISKVILFDPENADKYYTTKAPFNESYGFEVGFVNNIIGDVIKIGYGSGENVDHVTNMYASPPILIYDTSLDKNPAYVGSFADARSYYHAGDNCSKVVLLTKHCTPRLYIFYN